MPLSEERIGLQTTIHAFAMNILSMEKRAKPLVPNYNTICQCARESE